MGGATCAHYSKKEKLTARILPELQVLNHSASIHTFYKPALQIQLQLVVRSAAAVSASTVVLQLE